MSGKVHSSSSLCSHLPAARSRSAAACTQLLGTLCQDVVGDAEMCWTPHFYHCHETLNVQSTATHLLLSVGLHLPDPLPAHRSAKQKVKAEHWDNHSLLPTC